MLYFFSFKGFRSYVEYNDTDSQTNVPFDQMEGNWDYEPTLIYWKDYMVKFCFTLCFNVSEQEVHLHKPDINFPILTRNFSMQFLYPSKR